MHGAPLLTISVAGGFPPPSRSPPPRPVCSGRPSIAIAALAVGAIAAALLAPALVGLTTGGTTAALTNIAYPVADLLLVSFIAGLAIVSGRRPSRQLLVIGAGLTLWSIADGIFLYQQAKGTYTTSEFINSFWVVGNVLIAAAAIPRAAGFAISTRPWRSITYPVFAAVAAVTILTWDHFAQLPDSSVVLASLTLVAVCARLLLSASDNR